MSLLFRVPLLRRLLWRLADADILRVSVEEAFKQQLLRTGDRRDAVVLLEPEIEAEVPSGPAEASRAVGG